MDLGIWTFILVSEEVSPSLGEERSGSQCGFCVCFLFVILREIERWTAKTTQCVHDALWLWSAIVEIQSSILSLDMCFLKPKEFTCAISIHIGFRHCRTYVRGNKEIEKYSGTRPSSDT